MKSSRTQRTPAECGHCTYGPDQGLQKGEGGSTFVTGASGVPHGVQGAMPPLGGPGGQSPPEENEFQQFQIENVASPGIKLAHIYTKKSIYRYITFAGEGFQKPWNPAPLDPALDQVWYSQESPLCLQLEAKAAKWWHDIERLHGVLRSQVHACSVKVFACMFMIEIERKRCRPNKF